MSLSKDTNLKQFRGNRTRTSSSCYLNYTYRFTLIENVDRKLRLGKDENFVFINVNSVEKVIGKTSSRVRSRASLVQSLVQRYFLVNDT